MGSQGDVRRIALSLPETTEDTDGFRFLVDGKQFAWSWLERLEPKRARVPNRDVVAVRVANETEKQGLLAMDPDVFFTERTTTATRPSSCACPPSIPTSSRSS